MYSDTPVSLRVYIVGNSSLCIQCGNLLLKASHTIHGIATSDREVEKWALRASIPYLYLPTEEAYDVGGLLGFLKQNSFDYLFSIDNPFILEQDILNLPRVFAINYHDAPLPLYAGLNATTWAINNQENFHGVSWHVMEEEVDSGDILKYSTIELSQYETALTLNVKCYERAVSTFTELVDNLSSGRINKVAQNHCDRTFFHGYQEPTPACTLDWSKPADKLFALVRSLDFGVYPNPIGFPKLYLDGKFFVVTKLVVLESKSGSPFGTIIKLNEHDIVVSTADKNVAISGLHEIDGPQLEIKDAVQRFGLETGLRFSPLDTDFGRCVVALKKDIHKHETYWVKRFSLLKPLQLPFLESTLPDSMRENHLMESFSLPLDVVRHHRSNHFDQSFGEYTVGILATYFARLTGVYNFDIGFRYPSLKNIENDQGMHEIFSPFVPLLVDLDAEASLWEGLEAIKAQLTTCKQRKTFAFDLPARFPQSRTAIKVREAMIVAVDIVGEDRDLDQYDLFCDADLVVKVAENINDHRQPTITWIANPSKIDPDILRGMLRHFQVFLGSAIENPDQRIKLLPLLSKSERHQMLIEWNRKFAEYPQQYYLHELFEKQVERVPESTAVIFENKHLSYKQLNSRSNQIAYALNHIGIGPETLVGLYIERSFDLIAGILGVLKAGAAYVPLNLDDPEERLLFVLQDANPAVIVSQESIRHRLPNTGANVLCLDTDIQNNHTNFTISRDRRRNPDNLAYVIYTSGSNGRPKGVMMSHRSLVNRFFWELDAFRRNERDVVLQQFSVSFDYSVWEIFIALTSGASLVLTKTHNQTDSHYLSRLIKRHNVSIVGFVPAMLESMLNKVDFQDLESLRQVSTGGEELTLDLQRNYFKKFSAPLYNGYGPTEACIDATYWICDPKANHSITPIGRPLANSAVYIVDNYLQITPIGIPGELCISGVCLSRGYLNRPELTAKRFVADPFSSIPRAKMYRTGDLACYLPDGNIIFLGRIDNQVKIRGFRIELGEIETTLCQHTEITQAIVTCLEERAQKRLIAYIKTSKKPAPSITEIREWLRQKLPQYMIPTTFMVLSDFPQTSNGKVDRAALPLPTQRDRFVEVTLVKPRDEHERKLLEIWEKVFGFRPIGVKDNFFEIGGDSLLAEQIFLEIEQVFDLRWPLANLFNAPTIAQLAVLIRDY
jgi:amino acid adenylation domain-containing protein